MKKMLKFILAAIFIAVVFAAVPVAVQARNVTRVLQPGRVYTFTGLERRVISCITVEGTARYQFVTVDNRGDVLNYGFSRGQVSVMGDGRTQITPLAPMQVTFDSSRLAVSFESGQALRSINVSPNRSVAIENRARTNLHIRNNRAAPFEAVVTNAAGAVAFMSRETRLAEMSVPTGGELVLTALDRALEVYFPAMWYGENLGVTRPNNRAIFTFGARFGEPFVLSHSGENAITIEAEAAFASEQFSYEFITRDRQGLAISHGEVTSNRITVQPHRPMTVFPLTDGELFMPFSASRALNITEGTFAPAYVTLEPGQSLEITNEDAVNTYPVHFSGVIAGYPFLYDFTLRTDAGITFGIEHSAGTINLEPGARLTVTVLAPPEWAPQAMSVRFADSPVITAVPVVDPLVRIMPDEITSLVLTNKTDDSLRVLAISSVANAELDYVMTDENGEVASFGTRRAAAQEIAAGESLHLTNCGEARITFIFPRAWQENGLDVRLCDTPALFRHVLDEDESLVIANNAEDTLRVRITSPAPNAQFDYVLTDEYGEVASFGTHRGAAQEIAAGESLHFTNPNEAAFTLIFPAIWQVKGLTVQSAAVPALYRRAVPAGTSLRFDNINRSFNMPLRVEGANITRAAQFDFLLTGRDGVILEHGTRAAGVFNMRHDSRLTLTGANGTALYVLFPAVWHTRVFRIAAAPNPPLYHITLRPGETVILRNPTARAISLANNAEAGGAGFFVRAGAVHEPMSQPLPQPLHGNVDIPAGQFVTITATRGATLHIWLPHSLARQLRWV